MGFTIKGKREPGGDTVMILRQHGGKWEPLPLRLDLVNHSPTGFSWGYGGSGPSQLALAILAQVLPDSRALEHYQAYKWAAVAHFQDRIWILTEGCVRAWLLQEGITTEAAT